MAGRPKTLAEISKVINTGEAGTSKKLGEFFNRLSKESTDEIQLQLDRVKEIYEVDKDRLEVYEKLLKVAKIYASDKKQIIELLEKEYKQTKKTVDYQEKINRLTKQYAKQLRVDAGRALDDVIKKNKEIFEISHDIQLQGNMTWRQYTELFGQAYDTARKMNSELNKQLFTSGEIVKTQNAMLAAGWRNIDTAQLTSLSAQASLLTRTLGQFPVELQHAFQMSFRQFGSQTDRFMNMLGNSLNTFSNTFGITVNMLTQTVSTMMASNTFLARNNMNAQIAANQSLMQALALSTQVGINTSSFITNLANTAQFGTASQMANMYQAGSYLQGFNTSQFQEMMIDQDYMGATQSLISSIYSTLGGMEPGYLRNEYMARIGQGFGLSQDDILQIMTNGNNLQAYSIDVQSKLLQVNNSMEDEIRGLRMTIEQQLQNWWTNSQFSEAVGSILQDTGLYGIKGMIGVTNSLLAAQLALNMPFNKAGQSVASIVGPKVGGFLGAKSTIGGVTQSNMSRLTRGAAGVGLGIGSNVIGYNMIANNTSNNGMTNFLGGAANVLGGAAGGALAGSAFGIPGAIVGAIAGGIIGGFNTAAASQEKKSRMEELDAQARQARRQAQVVQTGDPVVDAINRMDANLSNILQGEFSQSRNVQILLDAANRNKFQSVNDKSK